MAEEDQVLKELDQLMDDVIDTAFGASQEALFDDGKVDTGNLANTALVQRSFLHKTIVYPASYAETVHNGRAPGSMPPPQALQKWVMRKLEVADEKQAKQVAYAIAKSIERRGIEAFPFLEMGVEKAKSEFNL